MASTRGWLTKSVLVMMLLSTSVAVGAAAGADVDYDETPWPMWHRSHNHTSFVDEPFLPILDPVTAWTFADDFSSWGVAVGDFRPNIIEDGDIYDRDGMHFVYTTARTDGSHWLVIFDGFSGKKMWEHELAISGADYMAAPVISDFDQDGLLDIIILRDDGTDTQVTMWTPEIQFEGNQFQDIRHPSTSSGQRAWIETLAGWIVEQDTEFLSTAAGPTIMDLGRDGDLDLVFTLYEGDFPVIVAAEPTATGLNQHWSQRLENGGRIASSPALLPRSEDDLIVVASYDNRDEQEILYTYALVDVDGSVRWDRSYASLASSQDVPYRSQPAPVIANLNNDADPEVVVVCPADRDTGSPQQGATVIVYDADGSASSELASVQMENGYLDAPPAFKDSNNDGRMDLMGTVSWYRDSGLTFYAVAAMWTVEMPGSTLEINNDWTNEVDDDGSWSDGWVAVIPSPYIIDIDGDSDEDMVAVIGQRLWSFESAGGNTNLVGGDAWNGGIDTGREQYTQPVFTDINGDQYLDILLNGRMITHEGVDLQVIDDPQTHFLTTPSAPNVDDVVTVQIRVDNVGTQNLNQDIRVEFRVDGQFRASTLVQPDTQPILKGGQRTFEFNWTAVKGIHTLSVLVDSEAVLDELREDNNFASRQILVLPEYDVEIIPQSTLEVVDPGQTVDFEMTISNTGRNDHDLDLTHSSPPQDWTYRLVDPANNLTISTINISGQNTAQMILRVTAPVGAAGGEQITAGMNVSIQQTSSQVGDDESFTAVVTAVRGVLLEAPGGDHTVIRDNSTGAGLIVTNIGNTQATYQFVTQGVSTPMSAAPISPVTLGPGEDALVVLNITATSSAALDTSRSLQVTVEDITDSQYSATVNFDAVVGQVGCDICLDRVAPGDTASFVLQVDNPYNSQSTRIKTLLPAPPSGMTSSLTGGLIFNSSSSRYEVDLTALSATEALLEFTVPEDKEPGDYVVTLDILDEPQSHVHSTDVVIHVDPHYEWELTPSSPPTTVIQIDPGNTENVQFGVRNLGNLLDCADLNYTAIPPLPGGWNVALLSTHFQLAPGAQSATTMTVELPSSAISGTTYNLTLTAISCEDPTIVTSLSYTIIVKPSYQPVVTSPSGLHLSVVPIYRSEIIEESITLQNSGNAPDMFDLTVTDQLGWNIMLDRTQVQLAPTFLTTLNLTIEGPGWGVPGITDQVLIEARSQNNTSRVDVINFTLQLLQDHTPVLEDPGISVVFPDQTYSMDLNLTNMGNADDTFTLGLVSPWTSSVNPGSIAVGLNNSTEITIQVTPDSGLQPGETQQIVLEVSAAGNQSDFILDFLVGQLHAITADPWLASLPALPDRTVQFPLDLSNLGNGEDDIDIVVDSTALPTGWTASATEPQLRLAPAAVATTWVEITPAASATYGETGSISVELHYGDQIDLITLTATISQMVAEPWWGSAEPGVDHDFDLVVMNLEQSSQTFTFTATGLTLNSTSFPLGAGQTGALQASYAPPSDSLAGERTWGLVTALDETAHVDQADLVLVTAALHRLQTLSAPLPQSVTAGDTLSGLAVTVQNIGNGQDLVSPKASGPAGWTIGQPPAALLAADESHTFLFDVTVPGGTVPTDYYLQLGALSGPGGEGSVDSLVLVSVLPATPVVSFSSCTGDIDGRVGDPYGVSFRLESLGSIDLGTEVLEVTYSMPDSEGGSTNVRTRQLSEDFRVELMPEGEGLRSVSLSLDFDGATLDTCETEAVQIQAAEGGQDFLGILTQDNNPYVIGLFLIVLIIVTWKAWRQNVHRQVELEEESMFVDEELFEDEGVEHSDPGSSKDPEEEDIEEEEEEDRVEPEEVVAPEKAVDLDIPLAAGIVATTPEPKTESAVSAETADVLARIDEKIGGGEESPRVMSRIDARLAELDRAAKPGKLRTSIRNRIDKLDEEDDQT